MKKARASDRDPANAVKDARPGVDEAEANMPAPSEESPGDGHYRGVEEQARLERWRQEPASMLADIEQTTDPRCGESLVRLVNVHKAFGSLKVLRGVSLDFCRGHTTVVIGPSGTGKSVLLKHIVGLLQPDRGEVYFGDQRVDQLGERELVAIRTRIGFLFQMGGLFDSLDVGDNVEFPLVQHTRMNPDQRAERCDRVLRMVGLSGLQRKFPIQLSGGQKKRVALARAIIMEPLLVLYDEPTTGLDPIRSDLINELIIGLGRKLGITSLVVTHDMTSALKVADRMILLYEGRVCHDGTPRDFVSSDDPLVQRFIQGQADQRELSAIRSGLEDADAENHAGARGLGN
ncbi:MAG: ABC transporter ATP-binding protein [Phycisphaeraceae bacterium]